MWTAADECYDRALVCRSGHAINGFAGHLPQFNKKFCPDCGADTLDKCLNCQTPIQGQYLGTMTIEKYVPPAHCHDCGKAFPWTEARQQAIIQLLELTEVPDGEREALARALPALAAERPDTPVAVARWRKFLASAGRGMASSFRELIVNVASDVITRQLFGA